MGVEVLGSIGVGFVVGSLALIAFGADSLVELLSAFVVAGHLKGDIDGSEMLGIGASRFGSVLLFLLLPIIGLGALYTYLTGVRPEASPLGILIALGAVIVMPYLWLEKRKVGEETNCLPLKIDAVESATCFFMSLSLLAGLLVEYFLGWWWADYLAAGAILVFVAKEAIEACRESYGRKEASLPANL
jgi:divalent metal cation (Fe/Co/Zn/Cd) transporter